MKYIALAMLTLAVPMWATQDSQECVTFENADWRTVPIEADMIDIAWKMDVANGCGEDQMVTVIIEFVDADDFGVESTYRITTIAAREQVTLRGVVPALRRDQAARIATMEVATQHTGCE